MRKLNLCKLMTVCLIAVVFSFSACTSNSSKECDSHDDSTHVDGHDHDHNGHKH